MKELINQYRFEADRIEQYISALKKELAFRRDVELVNSMSARIRLLEEERYEILRDISDMQNGMGFSKNGIYANSFLK